MAIAKNGVGWVMGPSPPPVDGAPAADAHDATFLPRARTIFTSGAADDAAIKATIAAFKADRGYTLCPHTASGVRAALVRASKGCSCPLPWLG